VQTASLNPSTPDPTPPSPPSRLAPALRLGQLVASKLADAATEGQTSSFRRLAAHELRSHAPSSLWRALNVFRLAGRYPELATYVHIGVGHVSVVLTLPETEGVALLRRAELLGWSRRHLESEVRAHKQLPTEASDVDRHH
jgi:hypothetical protein